MQGFATDREAKEFLIGKIVDQAQRDGVALSDVERKNLYWSETGWTLPDIDEVDVAFERDYSRDQYEKKIVQIIRQLRARERRDRVPDFALFEKAIEKLREGDHYVLGLIDESGVL
jgi:hypothetical protein